MCGPVFKGYQRNQRGSGLDYMMTEALGKAVAVTCAARPGPGKAAGCNDDFFGPDRFFGNVDYKCIALFGNIAGAAAIEKIYTQLFCLFYKRISDIGGTVAGGENAAILFGPYFEP